MREILKIALIKELGNDQNLEAEDDRERWVLEWQWQEECGITLGWELSLVDLGQEVTGDSTA